MHPGYIQILKLPAIQEDIPCCLDINAEFILSCSGCNISMRLCFNIRVYADRDSLPFTKSPADFINRPEFRQGLNVKKKDIAFSALMGALSPFAYYLVLFKAYEMLPAQVAQPLNMVWPIVLVFLSVILLKQKISSKSFIALFISFIGVYFISSQ